jgi:hypothetical protein
VDERLTPEQVMAEDDQQRQFQGVQGNSEPVSADELLVCVAEDPPDAVIVDIRLPPSRRVHAVLLFLRS